MSFNSDLNKYTPRKEQTDCLEFIKQKKSENPDAKFFLLDLPTGTGKSHLAMMIIDWYLNNPISKIQPSQEKSSGDFVNDRYRVDIITATKILQDQYNREYDSPRNLKGKENYECVQYITSCHSGKEFARLNKTPCENCPYDQASDSFNKGRISLTNFHLYLIHSLYNKQILDGRQSRLLIVDECDQFDDVMSDSISIKITENIIKRMKFSNESKIINKLKKINNITQYITFLQYFLIEVQNAIEELDSGLSQNRNPIRDKRKQMISSLLNKEGHGDIKIIQIISDLKQYCIKIEHFLTEWELDPQNWVLERTWNDKTKEYELSLEPIWAYNYLKKYVWERYDMVILMSGTILNKDMFCELNGLDKKKSVYWNIPSQFPTENRPIYYLPLGKMSFSQKEVTFQKYKIFLKKILDKYSDKKGIIHTNSFELSGWIEDSIKDPRLIFHTSQNKDIMLNNHFESKKPTVIVSPSVSTGVSFDNEKSRFQVIAKVPYPSLSSQKNKMRQKIKPDWYTLKTVSGILQSYGRSIRSHKDWADTIIIDSCFGDLLAHSSHFFPEWFSKAIKKINVKN